MESRRITWGRFAAGVAVALVVASCGSRVKPALDVAGALGGDALAGPRVVRTAHVTVAVDAPGEAAGDVEALVQAAGGFVESSRLTEGDEANLRCRVPAAELDRVLDEVAALGEEQQRTVSADDVTERYTDLEARLGNSVALRDRLQALLDRAVDVQDVLDIERELTRVQSEVETMQAQLDRLRTDIAMSAMTVRLEQEEILGPLGYLAYGAWWVVSSLFVIQ